MMAIYKNFEPSTLKRQRAPVARSPRIVTRNLYSRGLPLLRGTVLF
jgi:hypothetical protein